MDEMFVEFFDAIDDLSDNEQLEGTSGSHGCLSGSLEEVRELSASIRSTVSYRSPVS